MGPEFPWALPGGDVGRLHCSNANEANADQLFDYADGVSSSSVLESCPVCDAEARLRCPNCGTRYCQTQCFRKDWRHHQALCKPLLGEFAGRWAPPGGVRAILFPVDSAEPRWVWLRLDDLANSIIKVFGVTREKPFEDFANQLAMEDINKGLRHRQIGHGLRRFTAPRMRMEGSPRINYSILNLAEPGSLKLYFGPALFVGFRSTRHGGDAEVHLEDARPRDLRLIIEWYYTRPENPWISAAAIGGADDSPGEKEAQFWAAVKLNCTGDADCLRVGTVEEGRCRCSPRMPPGIGA
ncbi:hypothetical protein F4802DRAFT_603349 [Xylaria palmicola]|nr:hypothetical protein F4802DRAFT_603349 [Xylaria palmicola]